MRRIFRGLQILGLALLPLAMTLQLTNAISLGQMLTMAAAGFAVFWIGRIVEGYAQ